MNISNKKIPKIGLALGSGGAKGYAHIGVIKVFEKNKIPIDFIAGSSFGAFIGSLYALHKDIRKVEQLILSADRRQFSSFFKKVSFKDGLIKSKSLERFVDNIFKGSSFKDLNIPCRLVATDFETAEPVEIYKGKIAPAVGASICFPLIFEPVFFNQKKLLDGGLSNPVPANIVRKMGADIVVAVNLDNQSYFKGKKSNNFYSLTLRSINFLQYSLSKECLKSADITIEPQLGEIGIIGLNRFLKGDTEKLILEGERAAELILPKLNKIIKKTAQKNKIK